ncbi:MAG: hypothetical protein IPP66_03525 [Anaerolineales bacterium]|nr:hypothetical protein [Anaerolineales bacterium]
MPRRYQYTPRRRRRDPDSTRRRSVFMRPSVQITIVLVAALIIYVILQSAGK